MAENLRLCPQCCEGHMRPISKVAEEDGIIEFYECDNEYCRYKSANTGMDQGVSVGEQSNEPIMCSKCNILFNSELGYKQHYDEKHNASTSD